MKLKRNLIVGLCDTGWSAILTILVVPLYIKYLGIELYGLVGFYVTLQAALMMLDLGLAPTINREVARCSASNNMQDARNLLHTFAFIYWGVAFFIAIFFFVLSPFISDHWLNSIAITRDALVQVLILIGVVIACRWPIGLYKGAVIGAQRLIVSSTVNIIMTTLGNVGVVVVMAYISPTIEAFFLWQAIVGLVYVFTIRLMAWKVVGWNDRVKLGLDSIKRVWKFSAGVGGVTISAVVLIQLDKILLSKLLSLEDYGGYTLAGVLASGLYVLLTPVFNTIFPRMSSLVVTDNSASLESFYRLGTRMLTSVLFPIALTAAYFSHELVYFWTGDKVLASNVSPVVSLLLIGTSLNGAMHFPYALQLAFGKTKLPLIINAILMVLLVPLIFILASKYGAVGGALAWLTLNILYLLFGSWLTHQYLLKGVTIPWLLWDVMVPLGLSIFIIGVLGGYVQLLPYAHYIKLFLGAAIGIFAAFTIIMTSPQLRVLIRGKLVSVLKSNYSRI